ncbi:craniofacial development protein 2-like [Coccinella septempunctata]|uniref:craniofacial development protein 2-like n=1 Tax=Coccinella septempunctata TaxID=41139 RepID=UPI001D08E548|nr:craniofacial development protein 2-like [Coccinella septempunctata]
MDGFKRKRHMLRKRTMKLATWNIQGLRTKQGEVFQELEKMKVDICVLTETKRKGVGSETIGEYIHFYSGVPKDARAKRGVSIAVHKRNREHIKSWEEIDEQIMTMEFNKNGHQIVIVGVYAPSDDAGTLVKDEFYGKLTNVLTNIENTKEVIILGDLNGRTGKEDNSDVVGKYGESATNNNGMRLRYLCESMNLKIMNGYFAHKHIHKFTSIQAARNLRSIIDYVIQKQHSKLKTTDVRVHREAEC